MHVISFASSTSRGKQFQTLSDNQRNIELHHTTLVFGVGRTHTPKLPVDLLKHWRHSPFDAERVDSAVVGVNVREPFCPGIIM